ncbi:MAG: DUF3540 domain-containing protein [Deltaproteobacteria bacterium]|jgi:hypothetical protein|nr:DUF3540 domain-containing protein [Deltaproteobacteria bacterium]
MAQAAEIYESVDVRLATGKVLYADDSGLYRAVMDNAAFEAGLAASCLLRPEKGDTVLLAVLEDGSCVILSILVRGGQEARLCLPPESSLECPGRLTVRCADALDLQAGRELGLRAEDFSVAAQNAVLHMNKVNAVSDVADVCCRALSVLGGTALSVFRSLTQCLGSSRRMVEGNDETRCANSTLVADGNATVMSRNGLTLAEETARTDAKLIQLG